MASELFDKLGMIAMEKQELFIARALQGSVQGRFSRQSGATQTLCAAAGLFASRGERVIFVAGYRMHEHIATRLHKIFAALGLEGAEEISRIFKDEHGREWRRDHRIIVGGSEIYLRTRWNADIGATYSLFEAPVATATPAALESCRAGTRIRLGAPLGS